MPELNITKPLESKHTISNSLNSTIISIPTVKRNLKRIVSRFIKIISFFKRTKQKPFLNRTI